MSAIGSFGGRQSGSVSVVPLGTRFYLRGTIAASPGATVTVFTTTVPALTTRYLYSLFVTAYNDGQFSLEAAGIEIAAGLIHVSEKNISFNFDPPRPIGAGVLLELKYLSDSEPNYPCPITAFLSADDVT